VADFDDPLPAAFARFRNQVAPFVRPAGTAPARATVRTRRRRRAAGLGVLVALMVAIPAAAYATVGRDPHDPPPQTAASPSASHAPSPAAHLDDLAVEATTLTFHRNSIGYLGKMQATVRNRGTSATPYELIVHDAAGVMPLGQLHCRIKPPGNGGIFTCTGSLAAGASTTLELKFTSLVKGDGMPLMRITVRAGGKDDADPTNNEAEVAVEY